MTSKTKKGPAKASVKVALDPKQKAQLAVLPSLNAGSVIRAYQTNVMGADTDINELILELQETFKTAKSGDLGRLENMLIGQATALQSIFTSLEIRAQGQEYQRNYQAFLTLALKAQSQSRATIQALVDLKYPRQVAFVKQANISHGPQQVNNGTAQEPANASEPRAERTQTEQSKLLEGGPNGISEMDGRAATVTGRQNSGVEALEPVDRSNKFGW